MKLGFGAPRIFAAPCCASSPYTYTKGGAHSLVRRLLYPLGRRGKSGAPKEGGIIYARGVFGGFWCAKWNPSSFGGRIKGS